MRGDDRHPESQGRVRFLDADEEARLMAELPELHRTIALVGLHAGLRVRSEALTLRWADVDLRRGLLTVQAAYAKSGKTRSVPINSVLRPALVDLRAQTPPDAEHVFCRRDGNALRSLRTVFMGACERAGLADVTPHVLRHTFASRLAMAGVDLRTIQELGGWRTLGMVQRYAHVSETHKADALERLANSPTLFTTSHRATAHLLPGATQAG